MQIGINGTSKARNAEGTAYTLKIPPTEENPEGVKVDFIEILRPGWADTFGEYTVVKLDSATGADIISNTATSGIFIGDKVSWDEMTWYSWDSGVEKILRHLTEQKLESSIEEFNKWVRENSPEAIEE